MARCPEIPPPRAPAALVNATRYVVEEATPHNLHSSATRRAVTHVTACNVT